MMVAVELDIGFYYDQKILEETPEIEVDISTHRYLPKIQKFSQKMGRVLKEESLIYLVEDLEFVVTMENKFQDRELYPGDCGIYPNTLFDGISQKILKTRMFLIMAEIYGYSADQSRLNDLKDEMGEVGFWDFRKQEFKFESYLEEILIPDQMWELWGEVEKVWDTTSDQKEDLYLDRIIHFCSTQQEANDILEQIGASDELRYRVQEFYK